MTMVVWATLVIGIHIVQLQPLAIRLGLGLCILIAIVAFRVKIGSVARMVGGATGANSSWFGSGG